MNLNPPRYSPPVSRLRSMQPYGRCLSCSPLLLLRGLGLLSRLWFGQVPRLDDPALCFVDVFLALQALDADFDPVASPDNVLAVHALRRRFANLLRAEVDIVADVAGDGENEEENDERDDLAV